MICLVPRIWCWPTESCTSIWSRQYSPSMLDGWARQQGTRFLDEDGTITPRLSVVQRFAEFTDQYPWQWEPAEVEAYIDHLRSWRKTFAVSTRRNTALVAHAGSRSSRASWTSHFGADFWRDFLANPPLEMLRCRA